jgi:DNA-binding transcriptional LysR family regulator
MDQLEIHALRVFLEAARTLNFSEAARSMNITQPAISMQVRSLEDYLDVKLFDRGPQGTSLTRIGEAMVPMAQRIIEMVNNTEESIRATASEVAGELIIGSSATVGKYILPHIVSRFRRQYPNVHVSIPVVSRLIMMEGVTNGEIDIGVTSLRLPDFDVSYASFCNDHLGLITPSSHPWARRESVEAHELSGEAFVCREPESACRVVVAAGLEPLGVEMEDLDIVMQVGSAEALAMAVEHGIGLAFVSLLAAMPWVALGKLAVVKVAGLELKSDIELVSSRTRPASAPQVKFMEFINQSGNRSLIQTLAEGRIV